MSALRKVMSMQNAKVLSLVGLALLIPLFSGVARADEWYKKTVMTFNEPVEVPGTVLPAGTYVFKLLDSTSDRHIIQIFNKDENHLYATILAIPDYRMEPTGKTVVTFEEREAGSPQAVRAWFYPGDLYGQEFVYPKVRAVELAKQSNQHVLSMPSEIASKVTQSAKPAEEAMKKAPVTAIKPSGEEVQIAEVHPPKPVVQTTAAAPPKHLPKTASPLPLLSLVGLFLMTGGFALRRIAKRAM